MKAKSILANATIIIIAVCVFLNGYANSLVLPVYADATTDAWTQVTTNDQLVEAFKYYCKSRDLTIEGSIADGVTSFTTNTFNNICNLIGINVTALQAHLKYQTDGNNRLRFLFDQFGISAYNRIFSQFLQDNNLEVGDSADETNNTVYSGEVFTDKEGYKCLVYYVDSLDSYAHDVHNTIKDGTYYKYSSEQIKSHVGGYVSYEVSDQLYQRNIYVYEYSDQYYDTISFLSSNNINNEHTALIYVYDLQDNNNIVRYGYRAIFKNIDTNKYYYGHFLNVVGGTLDNPTVGAKYWHCIWEIPDYTSQNANVYLTTNNTVINNNTYEGDTIINNNGTTEDDDNPSGGGGGNTITPPGTIGGNGSDGTINFPDFNINLPEINWSLGDLSSKFPFCIPFDMIALLRLLNGQPQAPHITGSIPLTSHYTWNLDLDFSQFDTFAGIMRGLEFVGFLFFLVSATINIVRG